MNVNTSKKTRMITKVALLSVIAFVIMFVEMPLFIFPPFLKIDFSDLPALIGALALGPVAGIIIEGVKNVLHFVTVSQTGGVGELANFIVGSALIVPAAIVYKARKTKKAAVAGMLIGVVCMSIVAAIMNYYVLLPFYSKFMPIELIIEMSAATNPIITDMKTLILYGIIPFNIIKGLMVTIITAVVYKKISPLLH